MKTALTPTELAALVAFAALAPACTILTNDSVSRQRFGNDFHCPAAETFTRKIDANQVEVTGCGQRVVYTCESVKDKVEINCTPTSGKVQLPAPGSDAVPPPAPAPAS